MIPHHADILRALARPGGASSDFDLNPGASGSGPAKKDAGVLVPLIERSSGVHVVLTKRAAHLSSHPGQIAFPGGKRDAGDADISATALREAHEETGLDPSLVEILGQLPAHETVTGFNVIPTIGWISTPWEVKADPSEVAEVFEVPLSHVVTAQNFQVQSRIWRGQRRSYYCVPYGPYYIWGATARILRGLADQMGPL
jgi:8-oxo-dGTP pyrophosphatase MutT (NUDIX family)